MSSHGASQEYRRFKLDDFSPGFVSVPIDEVILGDQGFLLGFEQDGVVYCFHAIIKTSKYKKIEVTHLC